MPHQPTIAIFSANQGHASLAQAVTHHLDRDYRLVEYKEPIFGEVPYVLMYQHTPQLFALPYHVTKLKGVQQLAEQIYSRPHTTKIAAFLAQHKPQLTISTYFPYNTILSRYHRNQKVPFINIIANPRNTHPLEVVNKPSLSCVFDQVQAHRCRELKSSSQPVVTGWFVRPEFHPVATKTRLRQRLKLDANYPTIVITGGSAGLSSTLTLTRQLLQSSQPLQIVIIGGTNTALLSQATTLSKEPAATTHRLLVLGFVANPAEYFQAADIVVCKAGPNTIFEAAACQVPVLAIGHISGQEDGNLDIIREQQLGWVEEDIDQAAQLLHHLVQHPEQVAACQPHIKKLRQWNDQAGQKLTQLIKQMLT